MKQQTEASTLREVEVEVDGPIMAVRLNRPEKKNAVTSAMYDALAAALETARTDGAIRIVTLSGRGDDFSAGNDLRDFLEAPPLDLGAPVFRFIKSAATFPKVLIAGVRGKAVGIGTTILIHCDLVLAEPSASFLLPFVDLGLVPEAASTLLLPRLIGRQLSAKHLLLAEPFDAQAAVRFGLVTHLVEQGRLEVDLLEVARRLADKPAGALLQTKHLLTLEAAAALERIDVEARIFADCLVSEDAKSAFSGFLENRGRRA